MKRRLVLVTVLLVLGAGAGLIITAKVSNKMGSERLRGQLLAAEKLLGQDKASEAAELLAPWRDKAVKGDLGEQLLALDMRALDSSGQDLEAMAAARQYLDTFPKGLARADAEYLLLKPLIETDASDPDVRDSVDQFLEEYPEHAATVRLQVALAKADRKEGKLTVARDRLQALWDDGVPESEQQSAADLLGEVNLAILFSPTPQPGETVIELAEGQYLYYIARDHDVPLDLLMAVNQVEDPRRLRIGQKIRVPELQFSLVCDKAENCLTVYDHGRFFKRYPVRTGRTEDSTPTGEFKIQNKKKDPTWRSPIDGKTYKPGDPKNELGTRWMSFEGDILGIHGTIHPETVGHYASNGCIGLLKDDVEELFTYIPVGTPLRIVGKQDLAKHRVIESGEENRVASN